MGLIVDDLAVAEKRFESLGVTIVKKPGLLDFSTETGSRALAGAYGFDDLDDEQTQKDIAAVLPGLKAIGFIDFVFLIADPDGNLFEVMPQDSPAT
jgi:lactoylglutathione lyase